MDDTQLVLSCTEERLRLWALPAGTGQLVEDTALDRAGVRSCAVVGGARERRRSGSSDSSATFVEKSTDATETEWSESESGAAEWMGRVGRAATNADGGAAAELSDGVSPALSSAARHHRMVPVAEYGTHRGGTHFTTCSALKVRGRDGEIVVTGSRDGLVRFYTVGTFVDDGDDRNKLVSLLY